jgi:thiol:disulfide interchange protein
LNKKEIMLKKGLLLILISSCFIAAQTQVFDPVKWTFSSRSLQDNTYELSFTANIEKGWHMYGLNIPSGGPIATSFSFNENKEIEFLSDLKSIEKPEVKFDLTFEMDLELFSNKVTFSRKVRVASSTPAEITGSAEFMVCDESRCLPPKEVSFIIKLTPPATPKSDETAALASAEELIPDSLNVVESDSSTGILAVASPGIVKPLSADAAEKSLFSLFLIALLAGFGALLTPCVYPIIPLTVSYFMRDTSRSKAIFNGLFFGFSIVLIYTMVGLVVGLTQIDLVRLISSHWLPNLIFLIIFIALAFSFFGMFEITLPGSLSNKIDQQADKGGFLGPFFMALATVVISFSCTGPIVGVVLGSAMQGEIIKPVVGMLGFSLSFALPFTLIALFPGVLKNMPKSGGWLNSVKVFFAFILLAFSLIFVSNLGLAFVSRSLVLVIAAVIFFLLGIYLLGKLKFSHDSELTHISVPRLLFSIFVFAFSVYLFLGLFGAPVKIVEPFLPPASASDFRFSSTNPDNAPTLNSDAVTICKGNPKYSDFLELPFGMAGYFDYDEALLCAKQLNKPVLLDFAGHYCKNCKKMYAEVWSDPSVQNMLRENFIIASLYTDDRTKLSAADQVTSLLDGKVKNTIGKKFNDLQISKFGSNALPLYVIVDSKGDVLTSSQKYYTYSSSVEDFMAFLNDGIKGFNSKKE